MIHNLSAESVNIGDYITFGSYEQDNNLENGPEAIEWSVIDKQENKVLLISRYALDNKEYTSNPDGATWETSDLRQWLNGEFFGTAFSEEEQSAVQTTLIKDKATKRVPNPGNPTEDKVFALSRKELESYFKNKYHRLCKATPYTVAKLLSKYNIHDEEEAEQAWWFLRSTCQNTYDAEGVGDMGEIYGVDILTVRPVLWLELNG